MLSVCVCLDVNQHGTNCNCCTQRLVVMNPDWTSKLGQSDLLWFRVPERIQFRLAVLAFCCHNHKAPSYLADELHWTDEAESRHRLRSVSCPRLIVPWTRLSTIGDRSFRVTVARAWNSLPTSITALTSLPSFKRQLRTFLFTKSFPSV